MSESELREYYVRRVSEYDEVYLKPERRADLQTLASRVRDLMRGHDVLELACGTGHWTAIAASVASSILATDVSEEMMDAARNRNYGRCRVDFALSTADDLTGVEGEFSACLAAFWWSHVPKHSLPGFLSGLHRRLGAGTRVVFLDNRYVSGSSTLVSHRDSDGNTYQLRHLSDGGDFHVLKNFPTGGEIRAALRGRSEDLEVELLQYYWLASYTTT